MSCFMSMPMFQQFSNVGKNAISKNLAFWLSSILALISSMGILSKAGCFMNDVAANVSCHVPISAANCRLSSAIHFCYSCMLAFFKVTLNLT